MCACRIDDVEGIESLRWEDQQKIRKYVEEGVGGGGGESSDKSAATAMEYGIEVSPTSRATCRHCSQKIMKGQVLFSYNFLLLFPTQEIILLYVD